MKALEKKYICIWQWRVVDILGLTLSDGSPFTSIDFFCSFIWIQRKKGKARDGKGWRKKIVLFGTSDRLTFRGCSFEENHFEALGKRYWWTNGLGICRSLVLFNFGWFNKVFGKNVGSKYNNNNVTSGKSQEKKIWFKWNEMKWYRWVIWIFHSLKNDELNLCCFFSLLFLQNFKKSKWKRIQKTPTSCPFIRHHFKDLSDGKRDKKYAFLSVHK